MSYVRIDIYKRYSICSAQDERDRKLGSARIEGNTASGFVQFFKGLGERLHEVIEACWTWTGIYDVSQGERRKSALYEIENCSRTSTGTRTGRPVCALIGHQSVRAVDNNWPSLLLRISVNRSNVSRVALPTHVRNTTSSPKQPGVL